MNAHLLLKLLKESDMGCCFGRPTTLDDIDPVVESLGASYRRLIEQQHEQSRNRFRRDPFQYYLAHSQCVIRWNQPDTTVGVLTVAVIELICRNGTPYTFKSTDYFQADVHNEDTGREVNCIIEYDNPSTIRVSFTVRVSGEYTITFMINGRILQGISRRNYQPGPPDPTRTIIHHHTNSLVLKCNTFYPIILSPKDSYGNVAFVNEDLLFFEAQKNGPGGDLILPEHHVSLIDDEDGRYEMLIKLDRPGYYTGCIKYLDRVLGLQNCIMFCLTEDSTAKVEQNLQCRFLTIGYNARLIPSDSSRDARKVKCFLSPRLFQIREYTLFISSRVFTCRVCNSTQFIFHSERDKFTLDDGLQSPVTLISPDREIIGAVFYKFIQRNIGGGESFQDKVRFFQQELQRRNPEMTSGYRQEVRITVQRFTLLASAMHATRGFKADMWKRKFNVVFDGEEGIDAGGVSREFFTCLCEALFSGRNPRGLFARLNDDPQALVHPNVRRRRDRELTPEHFEFAGKIVGKCLFETAQGNQLLVKAKFTRSFLAQIIGLRISWKHFETDDPELYQTKIEYMRSNSLTDLDMSLTFAEEEFDSSGGTSDPRMVSLTPGGSKATVTDQNKMDYLNQLAQYRLGKRMSEEIRHFLKGLHVFIPDDLLGMFDENELELLMCGMQELSVDDLRAHAQIRGSSDDFIRVIEWFWILVEEFSQEELSRLVQFVTGSSQIPTGGFGELRPPFLIASTGENGNRLPYAHTCFNHLCLPNYNTYEQFRTALMTAINEGSEGILLT